MISGMNMRTRTLKWIVAAAVLAVVPVTTRAQDSLCAQVQIEIVQELTLERQAFDARMAINNGTSLSLQDVSIEVLFEDQDNNPVIASSDPNHSSALFFITVDSMENIDDVSGRIPHFDDLGVEQRIRRHQPRLGVTTYFPLTPGTIHPTQHLEQGGRIALPTIGKKQRHLRHAGHHLGNQTGGRLRGAGPKGHPHDEKALHRQGGVDPFYLTRTPFRMRFIQLHPLYLHSLDGLPLMFLRPARRLFLKQMHRLDIDVTDIGRAFIADPPALTLEQLLYRPIGDILVVAVIWSFYYGIRRSRQESKRLTLEDAQR